MNGGAAQTLKLPLGKRLLQKGVLTEDQLQIALIEQKRAGTKLGALLVQLGFVTEEVLRDALAERLGRQSVDLTQLVVDSDTLKLIPKELAIRYELMPIVYKSAEQKLVLAMANPANLIALDQLRALVPDGAHFEALLASRSDILKSIDRCYGFSLSIDGILHEIETGERELTESDAQTTHYSQPVVRLIDALLADAVAHEASDIHFEPEASFVRIRYRVDGVLSQIRCLHKTYWPAMVVRLKVMAHVNIAETRSPQDGRISLHLFGKAVDFRFSSHPTTWGENIVLRILDRLKASLPIDALGIPEHTMHLLKQMTVRPAGAILVSGPTGSGKTTTLYSLLNHINKIDINIMTLEDPVEYALPLLRQTNIADAHKIGFALGIRSIMRQDPDVILIGEIRDRETAEMSFRAAMTGHQVYSTVHADSAIGVFSRLWDLGIGSDIMSGNIVGVVGQRLVRKLCPECKALSPLDEAEKEIFSHTSAKPTVLYHPRGCDACAYQGYKGRIAILEVLAIDSDLDDLIASHASRHQLNRSAQEKGFRPLAAQAIDRIREGLTTVSEASRVIDLSRVGA